MIKEDDIVFVTKDNSGNTVINMPITRLANIDSDGEIKNNSTDEDYLHIMDASNSEQSKKIKIKNLTVPTFTENKNIENLTVGEKIGVAFGKLAKAVSSLIEHLSDNVKHVSESERTSWNKKTTTTFTRALNSGTKIGTINIDGTATDLFCQTNTDTTYSAATATPKDPGTAAIGTSAKYAREDHIHNVQTTITGNAGTATKLQTARTITTNLASAAAASFDGSANVTPGVTGILPTAHGGTGNANGTIAKWTTARNINGILVQGDANRVNYGTCSTAAATVAKVVNCTGYQLITGSEITIKFTITNTATNPTLNVNNTGAKPIYYRGAAISAGYLAANRTYTFRYNGTQYELVGDLDTNTKYNAATTTAAGLMSAADKKKLDGIENNANNYTLPVASYSDLGGVKSHLVDSSEYIKLSVIIDKNGYMNAMLLKGGNLSVNAETATKLKTARTIAGMSFNGSANIAYYGTCSTAAATAAKVVALAGFTLVTGAEVTVKFTVTNTAANPTLNVNSTGAKAIYYRGTAAPAWCLAANRTYKFVYNGNQFELIGDVDTNTTYSAATQSANGLMSAADKKKLDSTMSITSITQGVLGSISPSNNYYYIPNLSRATKALVEFWGETHTQSTNYSHYGSRLFTRVSPNMTAIALSSIFSGMNKNVQCGMDATGRPFFSGNVNSGDYYRVTWFL